MFRNLIHWRKGDRLNIAPNIVANRPARSGSNHRRFTQARPRLDLYKLGR